MSHQFSRRAFGASVAALSIGTRIVQSPSVRAATAALAWEQLVYDGASPAARWDHSLAASDTSKQLLLFGGRNADGAAFADTWEFDRGIGSWTDRSGSGPSARFGHAIAMNSGMNKLYLFGGQAGDLFFNDLWAWDFDSSTWELIDDGTVSAPLARYGTSLVVTDNGLLIMSHGFTFNGRFNDTWVFDVGASTWTDVSPADETQRPLNRCLHEAVWDEANAVMLLYGGCSSGYGPCPQGDLWSFDPGASTWTLLELNGVPGGRMNPALVYDRGRKQTLLIGGLTDSGVDAGVWSIDRELDSYVSVVIDGAGPGPRSSHDACVTGPNLYLFGGTGDNGPTNDLWLARLNT